MNEPLAPESIGADLVELRRRIDRLDERLLALIAERCELVKEVQDLKRANGLPVRSPVREAEMFERARSLAQRLRVPDEGAVAVLKAAMRCCLSAAGATSAPADLDSVPAPALRDAAG